MSNNVIPRTLNHNFLPRPCSFRFSLLLRVVPSPGAMQQWPGNVINLVGLGASPTLVFLLHVLFFFLYPLVAFPFVRRLPFVTSSVYSICCFPLDFNLNSAFIAFPFSR